MATDSSKRRALVAAFVAAITACGSEESSVPSVVEAPPALAPEAPPPAPTPETSPAPPEPPPIDPTALPEITSGEGITVEAVTRVSPRTFDIMVSTPNVSPKAKTKKGNGVRVTLPVDYATSGKRYPVLFLMHGATCDFTTFSTIINLEEKTTDVIVVMPEGGVIGLYTDWVDPSPVQKWATYHLTQLVPFVDRNLRTIAAKEGRAIAGFSMGGLGAMRYAVDRPDYFAAAGTMSGVVDLQHGAFQAGLLVTLQQQGQNPAGPFGDLLSPVWGRVNPSARASRLATVKTFIYVGEGTDPVEAVTTSASNVLHRRLNEAKIPHFFENYGSPGETPEGYCNGGHTIACSRFAFADLLPRLLEVLADPR